VIFGVYHVIMANQDEALPFQDFGDPDTNNLGHKVTTSMDPITQQKKSAVFIPKLPPGYWSGAVENVNQLSDHTIVDDDEAALRVNQLPLGESQD
jgi:hypothetical protein